MRDGAADDASTDGGSPGETCDNGVDDDGDGDVDCADLDCLIPPLDATAPTRAWDAMRWVVEPQPAVSDCAPPQADVDTSDLPYARIAALRGRVLDDAGAPLAATVRVLDRPEWGATATRADGSFHFLVDPRENPVLVFEAPGRLAAQRRPMALDGAEMVLDDVVLLAPAEPAATVELGRPSAQLVQGPMVTDEDGSRQASVLFPAGTTASAQMPGGGSVPLPSLTLRATEYTVGDLGPAAMPGALPSSSAYTYAVELSADEATAMGAEGVAFDQPVSVYVDNFLDMPVGTPVPIGFYDRGEGRWEAEPDGIVLAIVAIEGGEAALDTDGDGLADEPATLDALGIDAEERASLGSAYAVGTELWRFRVEHFSPWDCNWPFGFPPDAILPAALDALKDLASAACTVLGSIVDCENQTLGEWLPIEGTGHRLHYQSERALGYESLRRIDVPLLAQEPPESLERIDVTLVLAGHRIERSFEPERDARFTYTWDGIDHLGRVRQGAHPYRLAISYVYEGVYGGSSAPSGLSFARPGEIRLEGNRTREEVAATRLYDGTVHVLDAKQLGLGTFTLDVHHTFDPRGQTLHRGDGRRRSSRDIGWASTRAAGGGGDTSVDIPAEDAVLDVSGAAVGPDGSLYLSDGRRHRIVRVDADGIVRLVAGTGASGYAGDGGPATDAQLNYPTALDFGPDGSLYFASGRVGDASYVVRRIGPDGLIDTLAGTGTRAIRAREGDGGLAREAPLALPTDVGVAPDGAVWIVCDSVIGIGRHFRVVDPSGRITTVPVNGLLGEVAFGGSSDQPYFTAGVGSDARLFHLRPDGMADRLAGGDDGAPLQVGVRGVDARYIGAPGLAVADDGRVFIGARVDGQAAVLELERSGMLRQIAGGGASGERCPSGAALSAELVNVTALAVGAGGELHVAGNQLAGPACRLSRPFATTDSRDRIRVASADGGEVYVFDARGRHLETRHAMTGGVLWTFEYDGGDEGPLTRVTDGDGNVLRIERGGDGEAVAIVGPWGHRTGLEVEAQRLVSATDPMGRTTSFTYAPGDLLESMTDPRGGVHRYDYDGGGRVVADTNATDGTQTFAETRMDGRDGIRHESPERRETLYERARGPSGGFSRIVTNSAGLEFVGESSPGTSVLSRPDGAVVTQTLGSDPRFGMVAPTTREAIIELPSGLTSTTTAERTADLSPDAPAGVVRQIDTITHGGRTSTRSWDGLARTLTTSTPTGRRSVETLDELGRLERASIPGLADVVLERDRLGRLSRISRDEGARSVVLAYGADGLLSSITNGEGEQRTIARDASGWITSIGDGEGRVTGYERDQSGALVTLVRGGGARHEHVYDAQGRVTRWTKPDGRTTSYAYDEDGAITELRPPSDRALTFGYDSAGRLTSVEVGGETQSHTYDSTTGLPSRSTSTTGEVTTYHYDGPLVVQVDRQGVGSTVTWERDEDLRVSSETLRVPGAADSTTEFEHDDDGLLRGAGPLTLERHPTTGLLMGTSVGGVTTTVERNAFGEVELALASADAARLYRAALERDQAGRVTRRTATIGIDAEDERFTYDRSSKLISWESGAGVARYAYDDRGLRTLTEDDRGRLEATYDSNDALLTLGALEFQYDPDGHRSGRVDGASRTTYEHDALGQLRRVVLPSGDTLSYEYDASGRRVARNRNGSPDRAWVFGTAIAPIAELDALGNVRSRFIYGTAPHAPDLMIRGGIVYRLIKDLRGSVRQVVDTRDGTVVQSLRYDPWGRVLRNTNPGFQPFTFAGGIQDPDTENIRLGLRDYDPETGRFLTPDPTGFAGGEDLYSYASGDPVNLIDPAGTHPLLFAFGFAVGCQLLENGGDWSAIDWGQVAFSVVAEMLGGPVFNMAARAAGRAAMSGAGKLAAAAIDAAASAVDEAALLARRYARPSGYRKGVRDQVWENAIEASTGRVRDPVTGRFMSKNSPWDMGHRPGFEFRKHAASAERRGINRRQFLDEHNDPSHFRPELPSSNRSHRGEDPTDLYLGP